MYLYGLYTYTYIYVFIYIYMHMPVLFVFVQLNGNVIAAVDLLPGKYMRKVSRACKLQL